jgi:hypothetical protein
MALTPTTTTMMVDLVACLLSCLCVNMHAIQISVFARRVMWSHACGVCHALDTIMVR